ncbi:hypothetical protein AXG93_4492s1280 [Marchantia polymorpha subsp. ruderalis]|uniref:choline-phosphate cytidylyltransferase n=1 Tax=Marchantia polymorpha subsp. ruderalis TaxID=1480154 RepID=A0A176W5C8_MARPO|nr:hypothetical protein AXG93_4492s1280 [Marchantia polymorpha subsp. ruderalis]
MARRPRKRQALTRHEASSSDDERELARPPSQRYEPHPIPVTFADNSIPKDRPVRVYADGIYDLFHFGHARSLEQAKKLFPNTYLLVGCCSDALTHKYKGKTVMPEAERYESLRHCKWVDEVVEDAPWVITQEFLDKHNIDFVAHDALPYADTSGAAKDVYDFVKKAGRFKETKRTDGVSTSDIIMRIVKDYNEYVMRNLARGYTRKDLGVSYVKEKQLRVNMGITKLRQKVKEQQERVGQKLNIVAKTAGMHHGEWVENADRWVSGFLEKFEEGCHLMESAIKSQIQKGLLRPQLNKKKSTKLIANGKTNEGSSQDSCAFWNCQLEKHSLVFSCVLFRLNVVDVYLLHVLPGFVFAGYHSFVKSLERDRLDKEDQTLKWNAESSKTYGRKLWLSNAVPYRTEWE